jgi:metal-responsive CopG/Arc/MetJ family transcriptional regulator
MAGQRGPNQRQVLVMFDSSFLREVDRAFRKAGYSERSKFIRDAVFEKLRRMGIHCDYEAALAPMRVSISHSSIRNFGQNLHLNEEEPGYGSGKKGKKK